MILFFLSFSSEILKVNISVVEFCMYKMSLPFQKKNSITIFLHGVNGFKVLEKNISGFILTERWEAGKYYIIFWSMTSKAEFIGNSPVLFL